MVSVLILFSCETNPPTLPSDNVVKYGKVIVTSDIKGAQIFVDSKPTGFVTPDTLTLPEGIHTIKLQIEGFATQTRNVKLIANTIISISFNFAGTSNQKTVLLEDFSNVSCPPCVESNRILENLAKKFGSSKLLKIKVPTNFPSPNDPFYLAAKADADSRISFYTIFSAPQIVVDGTQKPLATDSTDIEEAISTALNETVKFRLSVSDTIVQGKIKTDVTAECINADTLEGADIRLFAVVIEKEIDFTTPPGSNGETKFYDVMRKILPDKNGQALTELSAGKKFSFSFSTQIASGWNFSQLAVVVFVQNISNKKIFQSAISN